MNKGERGKIMKKKLLVLCSMLAMVVSLMAQAVFASAETGGAREYKLSDSVGSSGISVPFAPVAGTVLTGLGPMNKQGDFYDAPGAWNQFKEGENVYTDGTKVIFWNGETKYIGVRFTAVADGTFTASMSIAYAHADAANDDYDGAKAVIFSVKDGAENILKEQDFGNEIKNREPNVISTEELALKQGDAIYFAIDQKNAAFDTYKLQVTLSEKEAAQPQPQPTRQTYDLTEDYQQTGLVAGSCFSFVTGNSKTDLGPTAFVSGANPYYEGIGNSGIWQQLAVGEVEPLIKNGIYSRFWGVNKIIGTRFTVPEDGLYYLTFGVKWASSGAKPTEFDGVKVSVDKQDGSSVIEDTVLGFEKLQNFQWHYFIDQTRLTAGEKVDFNLNGFNNYDPWHSWDTYQIMVRVEKLSETYSCAITGENEVYVGETLSLTNTVYDAEAAAEGFETKWSVDNENVAQITQEGVLTGRATGTVTVTARAVMGVEACIATKEIVVKTREVVLELEGKSQMKQGEKTTLQTVVRNSEEQATFQSETPDILSVDAATGEVTALKSGVGVVSASIGSVKTEKVILVDANPEGYKTVWNFARHIPYEQGENSFYIVYGPKGENYGTDNAYLSGLTTDSCARSSDANQWKGSPNDVYATVGTNFMLPGDEVMGIQYKALADGTYYVNFKFAQTPGNLYGFADKQDALNRGFDGSIIGVAKLSADGTITELSKWDGDYDYFIDPLTATTYFDDEVALKKGEILLFYVNGRESGAYDQLDFTLNIASNTDGPLWISEKPEISGETQTFSKSDPSDIIINLDTKGFAVQSLKVAGKLLETSDYSYADGKLTIKKEALATIGNGLKRVEVVTEKGTVTCNLQITAGTVDDPGKGEKPNGDFPAWAIVLIVAGSLAVIGCVTFIVCRKKKRSRKDK